MIFPLLPVFLTEVLKASPAYLGFVEGAADTVSSLLKLVSGTVADRVPRRKPLVLFGYALASAARPFVALATRPWHVLAVRVTDRVGKGIRSSPRDALIADAAGDRPGRAFGFHRSDGQCGCRCWSSSWPRFWFLKAFSIRTIFWIAVIPGTMATILVALVREPTRVTAANQRVPRPAIPPGVAGSEPRRVLLTPTLRTYLGILALFSLANSSDAFLLLRARSVGLTTAQIPILWAVLNFSKVFWAYLGGNLADRISRARLIAAGWFVYALVYFGLAQATARWHIWALFIVYGIF